MRTRLATLTLATLLTLPAWAAPALADQGPGGQAAPTPRGVRVGIGVGVLAGPGSGAGGVRLRSGGPGSDDDSRSATGTSPHHSSSSQRPDSRPGLRAGPEPASQAAPPRPSPHLPPPPPRPSPPLGPGLRGCVRAPGGERSGPAGGAPAAVHTPQPRRRGRGRRRGPPVRGHGRGGVPGQSPPGETRMTAPTTITPHPPPTSTPPHRPRPRPRPPPDLPDPGGGGRCGGFCGRTGGAFRWLRG